VRLFGKVDGRIDRLDRAVWLTLPFDMGFRIPLTRLRARVALGARIDGAAGVAARIDGAAGVAARIDGRAVTG